MGSRIEVTMPQLGETVSEGTISAWLKAVGDQVVLGEALLEVSTDKVDTEIPAPASGVLLGPLVAEGQTVPVGTVLAGIGDPAESVAVPATVPAVAAPSVSVSPVGRADGPARLSPRVRRLVRDHGVTLASIHGSGSGGRVTGRDVTDWLASVPAAPTVPVMPTVPSVPVMPRSALGVPMSRIRRITAERTLQSLQTSAHVLSVVEVDFHHIDRVRDAQREQWREQEGYSLTYLPFICRAVIDALRSFPALNASIVQDSIVEHRGVELGIAVDLGDRGLVVPVVHSAHDRRMRAIARDLRTLAGKAREGTLTADETSGGTFTITNNGVAGSVLTAPIIVQPQVAILSTDAVLRRVVPVLVEGQEALAVHNVGNLSMSWDHRAVDGAYAARFLTEIKKILEQRDWHTEL